MSFNLLPWRENLRQRQIKTLTIQFLLCIFVMLSITAVIQTKNTLILRNQDKLITYLNSKKIKLHALKNNNKIQQSKIIHQKEIENFIIHELSIHHQFINFLAILNTLLPQSVYLTKLEKIEQSMQLVGRSPSHAEVALLLEKFNLQFPKEKLSLSETNHHDKNSDEIDFSLNYHINK